MRWDDERYVRVYTRDTSSWIGLSWEARAAFLLLLRAADRAGIIDLGRKGLAGLALMLHMPGEVLGRAVMELGEDGCINCDGAHIIIPNFIAAQEVPISDAQRKRDQRERARARALSSSGEVPAMAVAVPGHPGKSRDVPPNLPNQAVPNQDKPTKTNQPAKEEAPPRADPFPSPPVVSKPPDAPPEKWGPQEFWQWAQWKRERADLVRERPPHPSKLAEFWRQVGGIPEAVQRLKEAFYAFGNDSHWQSAQPPLPFGAFMSQWAKYMPQGGQHVGA